jgi:hypothetical protein
VKNKTIIGIALMALAACAGTPDEESVLSKNDPIDDFIEVADLRVVDRIRYRGELHHKQISKDYILVYDGKDKSPHLLAFQRRCHNISEENAKPDYRYAARSLDARTDTYRGCRIRNLYELTPGQVVELSDLVK